MKAQAVSSVRKIADELNARGILTPRGGHWAWACQRCAL